jgi:choice-of-anchor B domain-containing protein
VHLRVFTTLLTFCFSSPAEAHEEAGDPPDPPAAPGIDGGFPAQGIALLSWLPLPVFGQDDRLARNCWGYVSASGREYAIILLGSGTAVVEVTDPGSARVVVHFPRSPIGTRDAKVYRDVAYLSSDSACSAIGVQVLDLSEIDAGRAAVVNTLTDGSLCTHTLAVDELGGILYRSSGSDNNGLRAYDLADPRQPRLAGSWGTRYVHDLQVVSYTEGAYAGRQVAFCFTEDVDARGRYSRPGIDIVDVTDKTDMEHLSFVVYPNAVFSHQGWLSADRRHLYVNDEMDEREHGLPTTTYIIDVADLSDPRAVGSFTNGGTAVDHNLYVSGDRIYEANYRSGLRVFDATDPLAPRETAYFDTHPEDDSPVLAGLWGVYPFFPSGTIVGSDTEHGLFVWRLGAREIEFSYPRGVPAAIGPAGEVLQVAIASGAVPIVPGSAVLHLETRAGAEDVPLTAVGAGLFEARIPPDPCGLAVYFHVSAMAATGVTWKDPPHAPVERYRAASGKGAPGDFPPECPSTFRRGDVAQDEQLDLSDGIAILGFLFTDGRDPLCFDAADANDSGSVDISDAIVLFSFLYLGGPAPPPPRLHDCGPDPTPDELGCDDDLFCVP